MTKEVPVKVDFKVDVTEGANKLLSSTADTLDSSKGFLGKVFNEGAEEIGKFLKQEFTGWRMLRAIELTDRIQKRFSEAGLPEGYTIHPRIGYEILQQGSLQDDDLLQDWWSGIFISSLSENPNDEALIFLELKKSLSSLQAKMLKYFVKSSKILHLKRELLLAEGLSFTCEELVRVTAVTSILRIDRDIDGLRYLGLIEGGINPSLETLEGEVTLTALGLQFFARCNGVKDELHLFYNSKELEKCPKCGERRVGRLHLCDYKS